MDMCRCGVRRLKDLRLAFNKLDGEIPTSLGECSRLEFINFTANSFSGDLPPEIVLEANPWRETSKSVYVLTHQENKLCTMKTRRNHSEVERELGLLFSKGGKRRNQSKQSGTSTKFQMLVEDVQEGVLVLRGDNSALANDIRKDMKALNGKLLKAKDRNTKRDIRKELKTLSKEEHKRQQLAVTDAEECGCGVNNLDWCTV